MRRVLICLCVLGLGGCLRSSLREEQLSETLSQVGDPAGAALAARRAEALETAARLRVERHRSWLWHDLAMD
jgi:hypothetical protein